MTSKKTIKYITVPKFIINKFDLKECPYLELPEYVRKSGICLKTPQGVTINVESLTQLRDILTYFRAAAQVCLQLIYKHMVIEQKNLTESQGENVEKKDEDILYSSYNSLPKKMRHRRKFEKKKRLSLNNDVKEKNASNLELRFGVSNEIIWDKRRRDSKSTDSINNEFYRHLILQTRKPNTLVQKYSFLKSLFSGKNQCG